MRERPHATGARTSRCSWDAVFGKIRALPGGRSSDAVERFAQRGRSGVHPLQRRASLVAARPQPARGPRSRRRRGTKKTPRAIPDERRACADSNQRRYTAARVAGWSSQVARRAHNPEVAGSNPAPATGRAPRLLGLSFRRWVGRSVCPGLGFPARHNVTRQANGRQRGKDRGRGRRRRVVPERPAPGRARQRARVRSATRRGSDAPLSDPDQPRRSGQDPALAVYNLTRGRIVYRESTLSRRRLRGVRREDAGPAGCPAA